MQHDLAYSDDSEGLNFKAHSQTGSGEDAGCSSHLAEILVSQRRVMPEWRLRPERSLLVCVATCALEKSNTMWQIEQP